MAHDEVDEKKELIKLTPAKIEIRRNAFSLACTTKVTTLYFYFMDANTGKYIVLAGGALMLLGLIIYFGHDKLHWVGRLPGDIRIEKESYRFYFPCTTLLLLSLLLTLFIHVIKRFL